jgi:hypothetical protein
MKGVYCYNAHVYVLQEEGMITAVYSVAANCPCKITRSQIFTTLTDISITNLFRNRTEYIVTCIARQQTDKYLELEYTHTTIEL